MILIVTSMGDRGLPEPMGRTSTYYDVLGITAKAPQEIVTAVYRAWMHALKKHPDLGGDLDFAKKLNSAYETLKDPLRRRAYDEKICKCFGEAAANEKRRAPRTPVDVRIAFCIPPDGRWRPAQAVDASCMGLRLHTTDVLYVGTHVSIAFSGSAAPAAEAVVRWSKELGDTNNWRHECGVEFFNPQPDVLKRLGTS